MIQTINFYDFENGFKFNKRHYNYTTAGLKALFNYFEQLEDDMGRQIEFDPVLICSEYTEYDNIFEFHLDYDHEDYPDIDAIENETIVIMIDDESFIIQNFE